MFFYIFNKKKKKWTQYILSDNHNNYIFLYHKKFEANFFCFKDMFQNIYTVLALSHALG